MNPVTFAAHPLGHLIRDFRQEHRLSVKQMALRFGLPLERMRALEHDADLPTADEICLLADGLSEAPHRLFRAVKKSALQLLDEALHPQSLMSGAVAARPAQLGPNPEAEAVLLLPLPLRIALCDALRVDRSDQPGLQHAWTRLLTQPPAHQRIALEAAVAQLVLEGEEPEEPLFS